MSTRPKPRPRPRRAAAITPSSSPGPSSAVSLTQQPALQTVEDEDAMFLRNQGRTAQMWSQLSKITAEKETKKRKSERSHSSDLEHDAGSSQHRNRQKKPQRKNHALPDWTRKRPDELVISSDSEDDIPVVRNEHKVNHASKVLHGKPKRARSRSITPPPALPQYAIQRAREAVQQLVGSLPRSVSPTYGADDSMDTITLDPELAKIAHRVHTEVRMHDGPPIHDVGGPELVGLRVTWRPHPMNPGGQSTVWGFRQKRHDNFYALFGEVADSASVLVDNLVVTYEGKRVFASSNPHSIGMWAEAELEASDKITYQCLQENKRLRSPSVTPVVPHKETGAPTRERSASVAIASEPDSGGEESAAGQDEEKGDTFHLTIRSERTKDKDISLLVRPTTRCGAIVRAFLKKAGLEREYSMGMGAAQLKGRGRAAPKKIPALSVDGDRMDAETEIGIADLEDGDQVDVVGL